MSSSCTLPRYAVLTDTPLRAAVQALALIVLFASGLIDLARAIPFGPVTSQAVLTAFYFFAGGLLLVLLPGRPHPIPLSMLPIVVFWIWAAVSLAWTSAFRNGVQNVLVIGTMIVILSLAEGAGATEAGFALWLERQFLRSEFLAVALYSASVAWFGVGTNEVFAARSFGLFALFGVAHNLARWRYGTKRGLAYAIAITLLIAVSESRLALGIAVVLFPLSQLPTHRALQTIKMFAVLLVVAACSYAGFLYSDNLQQRFLSGDVSLKIGSIAINGSGRTAFWRVTMQSFDESPMFGKGAGSVEALIDSVFDMAHPHSDYLRIAHDYGIVGLVLWCAAICALVGVLWRRWRRFDLQSKPKARIQLTAFLCLVAFALEMTVENALVYVFVTAPLGWIVGSALGIRASESQAGARLKR